MSVDLAPFMHSTDGEHVRLVGSRCTACGTFAFPARPVCLNCMGRDNPITELSGRGHVRAWTRVELPPAGFDEPIIVATVDLDEGPSIFALLTGEPGPGIVEAVTHPVREHAPGYAFRRVS